MSDDLDADMAMCANLREADVFMHVTNRGTFGHLINADDFDTSHTHNELWEMIRNRSVGSSSSNISGKSVHNIFQNFKKIFIYQSMISEF